MIRDPELAALAAMSEIWHPAFAERQGFGGGDERGSRSAQSVGAQQPGHERANQPHQPQFAHR